MNGKSAGVSFPLAVTGRVPVGDGQELVVSAGVEGATRHLELGTGDGRHRARIEWDIDARGRRTDSGGPFMAQLMIDDDRPYDVQVASGCLLAAGDDGKDGEPHAPRSLEWLGKALLTIAATNPGPIDGFAGGAHAIGQIAKDSGGNVVTETAGCLADTAGAGAALGSTGGLVVGGVKGAGVGAAVGGAIGGAFGLGYCVVGPVLGGIWDWITG